MWTLCPHNPPNLERGARRGRFRLPPNERRRLLARFLRSRRKELPSPTSHSNRSLRTEVSVAGNGIFRAETKRPKRPRRFKDVPPQAGLSKIKIKTKGRGDESLI